MSAQTPAQTPQQPGGPTAEAEYLLGPQDRIRIKVLAWRPALAEIFEWRAVNDTYTIGASGNLALPLVGDIPAVGKTTQQLGKDISEAMRTKLGLPDPPPSSVEVVQFRPFYILGAVQQPGEYAYRPGLIVVQAVSLSGGMTRVSRADAARFDRETAGTLGDRAVVKSQIVSLLARRWRLTAEAKGLKTLGTPPPDIAAVDPQVRLEEEAIFKSRLAAHEERALELQRIKGRLDAEILRLKDDFKKYTGLVAAAQGDIEMTNKLLARQLTTSSRATDASRNAMLIDMERQRVQSNLAQTQRDSDRTEIELKDLYNSRIVLATTELRNSQEKLDELGRRQSSLESMLALSSAATTRIKAEGDFDLEPTYYIIRKENGVVRQFKATESTVVRPGDTIRVQVALVNDKS